MVRREPLQREQLATLGLLALLTVAAWALTFSQLNSMAAMDPVRPRMDGAADSGVPAMGGMEMGGMAMDQPGGSEPGVRLAVYLGMWVTMMAAMMLPAAAPMILMFGAVYRTKQQRGGAFVPTWVFVAEKLLPRERVVTLVVAGLLLTLGLLALAQPDLLVSAAFPHPVGSPSPGWAPAVRSAAVF